MDAAAPTDSVPTQSAPPRAGARGLVVFWLLVFYGCALGNTGARLLAARRDGEAVVNWQVLCQELSSATMSLLLLPLMFSACRRWPLNLESWSRLVFPYWLGSVAWWLLHVSGMVLLRKLVYQMAGDVYNFGSWPVQWLYEYTKDVQTFVLLVSTAHTAHWFLRRRQGEAQLLAAPDEGHPVEPIERPERFLVRKLGRDFLVDTADIEWIQAAGNYVNLHVRGHDYPLRSTMAGIEARLDPAVFVRVHRSYLVNLRQLVSIEPLDGGEARLHLRDGQALPCSRRHLSALRESAGLREAEAAG